MNKLLMLLLLSMSFYSCSNSGFEVDKDKIESETSIELINKAKRDTNIYHIVIQKDVIYVLDKNYLVKYEKTDKSGTVGSLLILVLLIAILIIIGESAH
jgi:hypothetical protein